MTDREKTIDKIVKLLALSKSPNEYEAVAAAEKAQALLVEHNLSITDLGATTDTARDCDLLTDKASWVPPLLREIATFCFCGYFVEAFPAGFVKSVRAEHRKLLNGRGDKVFLRHNFISTQANVIVARQMAEYLIEAIERSCVVSEMEMVDALRKVRSSTRVRSPAFRTSFLNACAARICYRLKQRRQEQSEPGDNRQLPAVRSLYEQAQDMLQKFLQENGIDAKPTKDLTQINDVAGLRAGMQAGDRIGLDRQLDQCKVKELTDG